MPAHSWISRIEIDHRGGRKATAIEITDDPNDGFEVRDVKFSDLPPGHQFALKQFVEGTK
ncbi:hypothetical protein Mbo2_050 [Rhodococcus phage Mbo2]|uniref:Uncharacterized protein n=1 Tax=Rhodococcus phage Mbo2 TaxID=2936911 RepID=A0A9E7IFM7_9CAUD|nr:hypothetical protein Mbo2_050 [Rhodococcus phage Mbo2]